MKCLRRIAPNKFLGKFTLQVGSKYIGIFMCCVSIICVTAFLAEVFNLRNCHTCPQTVLHHVHSYNINIVVYCLMMFFVDLWLIWGVTHQKPAVVLAWVVLTVMWWLQGSSLIFILILLNIGDFSFSWIATLFVAIIASAVFGYCILIGYAYWLQIKGRGHDITTPQT